MKRQTSVGEQFVDFLVRAILAGVLIFGAYDAAMERISNLSATVGSSH